MLTVAEKTESILDLESLAVVCFQHREAGRTIAHCHGAFDLLHPGHIHHFQAAKEMADVLVVTITEDRFVRKGPGRPVFHHGLRAEAVGSIGVVDHVALCPFSTGVEAIEMIKPDFYVKGQDYRDPANDPTGAIERERRAVEQGGGAIVFTDEIQFSSSQLLNDHFDVLSSEQRTYLADLKDRFSTSDVLGALDKVCQLSVLVVGEGIIDEYHYCCPDAMSNKSPTLSARFESAETFAGGVWAVGGHLTGLCRSVKVLAGTGTLPVDGDTDSPPLPDGLYVEEISRNDGPTVLKRRFVHRFSNHKLFEVTFVEDRPIPAETESAFLEKIDRLAPQVDLVIVTDFGHGLLTAAVIDRIRERSRFLAVNAQINSSNRGFNSIRKYRHADYVSVDEHEIRLPLGDRYGRLEDLIHTLSEELGCQRINVTLGDKGTLYFDGSSFHRAPVLTGRVVDTIGAGDALLAVTAPLVCVGAAPALIPFVGNCMGGLMTQIVGHRRSVDQMDLKKFVTTLMK